MKLVKHIPNLLTSINLLCGALATYFALNAQIEWAVWLIFTGALFDFSDGFAARALKAYSPMGKELDSLADLISFGMAPAAIFSTILKQLLTGDLNTPLDNIGLFEKGMILSPFILTVFAGLRLAKFNIDTRQSENFLGLTTTATGIFTASFSYMFVNYPESVTWLSPFIILVLIAFFCSLLVSEVPMSSLKFKNFKLKENQERYLLLLLAVVFIIWLGVGGIAALILYYILTSIGKWLLGGTKKNNKTT
jgi:CDP-diacylglycerol--serine O-phosphatidyltransferase